MIDDDVIITQRGNNSNVSNGMRQKMIEVDRLRERLLVSGEDRRDQMKIAVILSGSAGITPGSAQDRGDLAGIGRRSTRIAVISLGSGRDQLGSRRDQLRIEVILPGSAEDRRGLL